MSGNDLTNLTNGSKKTPTSPSPSKGVKVLPPVKPSRPKGAESPTPGGYELTTPPKVKSKLYNRKDQVLPSPIKSSPPMSPVIGPKPTPRKSLPGPSPTRKEPKRQLSQSSQGVDSDEDDAYVQMDPILVPGELTLTEFVKNFSHTLPQRVLVSKGVYGSDDETTLSTSDICNIHSLKKRNLVRLEEKGSKQTYSVPVNSAIKFAPIFNHHDSMEEITKGERFPYVSNLLDLVILPKVVCACQPYDGNPVDIGEMKEILAIKEVIHPESQAQKRKLRVYSFSDCCDKVLDETAYGDFSTRPSDIKLYMSDILKHVISPFPMHLLMFKDTRLPKMLGFPHHLFSRPLMMSKKFTEVILIATSVHADPEKPEPFEIPTEIDIDIQLVKLPELQYSQLTKRTETLKEQFESMEVRIYKYENMNDEMFRAQTKLYQLIKIEGGKEEGGTSTGMRTTVKRSLVQRIEKLERASDKYVDNQARLKQEKETNDQFRQFIKDKLAEQEKLITKQAADLRSAVNQIATLKSQLKQLSRSVHGADEGEVEEEYGDPRPEDAQEESKLFHLTDATEENRKKLAKLNTKEVIQLLQQLGLEQYEPSFLREGITGELLLECDEDLLQNELEVKSKLHRLRLLRIIKGSVDLS